MRSEKINSFFIVGIFHNKKSCQIISECFNFNISIIFPILHLMLIQIPNPVSAIKTVSGYTCYNTMQFFS